MPAEHLNTWSPAAKIAAHTELRDLLDTGSGAASITIHAEDDTLLSTLPLATPCGTVNGTTGALTLTPDGRDEAAAASGTPDYASIRDADGVVHTSLPAEQGTTPVPGKIVISSASITEGEPVELVSAVIV